jgi:hypothetical protein
MPTAEDCTTLADEDCDGKTPACKGSLLWAKGFGDAGDQLGTSIATDGIGNVLFTGSFTGSVDFGTGPLNSAGGDDIFVAKLDTNGFPLWSRSFGGTGNQDGASLAVDSFGNVFVTGSFSESVDFGDGELKSMGSNDIFIAKLDASGNHLWSKRFGDMDDQDGVSVAVDSAGNVLVIGYFWGSVDLGGGSLTSAGSGDIVVAKFDASGNHLWSKKFGDTENQFGASIAVDSSDNVLVTGSFTSSVDFGGGTLVASGNSNDIFVAKLDKDGHHLWSNRFGDTSDQSGASITVDGSDNVLITGSFTGSVNFGGNSLVEDDGSNDIFVAKFDAGGKHLWSKPFGSAGDQDGASVAVTGAGNVFVTGGFTGSVDFGGGPLASASAVVSDIFIVKLDASGSHQWSKRFGDVDYQAGASIALDGGGNVFATGNFAGTVDFGDGSLMSGGGRDVFVVKFSE